MKLKKDTQDELEHASSGPRMFQVFYTFKTLPDELEQMIDSHDWAKRARFLLTLRQIVLKKETYVIERWLNSCTQTKMCTNQRRLRSCMNLLLITNGGMQPQNYLHVKHSQA